MVDMRGRISMKIIDQTTWNRKEIFDTFSHIDYPFYSVTIPMDVTNVKTLAKQESLSFYHLMIWVCSKAIQTVPEFQMRIRGNDVVLLDTTHPSFTSMKKGCESFQIINMPWNRDYASFCLEAKKRSETQQYFLNTEEETDHYIYFSCTPWFDFTSLSNEHNFDKDDSIPRLAWGKYYEENNRLMVHLSIEVNHRLIDGFHIGKLKEAIDQEIDNLRNV